MSDRPQPNPTQPNQPTNAPKGAKEQAMYWHTTTADLLIRGYLSFLATNWMATQTIDRCTIINLHRMYLGRTSR